MESPEEGALTDNLLHYDAFYIRYLDPLSNYQKKMLRYDKHSLRFFMKITRIVSGLVCMVSIAWFAVEWGSDKFPFEPLIGFLLSFPTWAWSELKVENTSTSSQTVLHPNDIKLAEKLRKHFSPDTRRLLRQHDFGQPYNFELLKGAEEIANDWKGAEFEYENEELDNNSSKIVRLSNQLLEKLAIYSGVADNWPQGYYSIPTRKERGADLFSNQTRDHIREVEGIASELLENLDKFEKNFRKLSPESFNPN